MLPAQERGEKGMLLVRMPSKTALWALPRTMPFSLLLVAGLVKCHPCLKMTANQNHFCQ